MIMILEDVLVVNDLFSHLLYATGHPELSLSRQYSHEGSYIPTLIPCEVYVTPSPLSRQSNTSDTIFEEVHRS
jgi:hypothetical protein